MRLSRHARDALLLGRVEVGVEGKSCKDAAKLNPTSIRLSKRLQRNITHNMHVPISALPCEILDDIFLLCKLSDLKAGEGLRTEQILSHVSHSWREWALDTSLLWTRIEWHWPRRHDEYIMNSYLKRSKRMTIEIVMKRCPNGRLNRALWDLIKPELFRCRQLVVDFRWNDSSGGRQQLEAIQALAYSAAPALQSLNITSQTDLASIPFFTGGTPLLTHLALHVQAPLNIIPSLQSVTTLSLDVLSLAGHRGIPTFWIRRLQDMPCLTHLRLDNAKGRHFGGPPNTLPKLRTLYLNMNSLRSEDGLMILQQFSMPLLQELTIERNAFSTNGWGSDEVSFALTEMGATESPLLTRLCGWPNLAAEHLQELSRVFPFVEEIHAVRRNNACTWGTSIQRLTNSPHWSRLHTLGIAGMQLNDESLLSLDRQAVHSVKRLVLSPELVEEARGYVSGAALPFEVASISSSTPFPLTGLDRVSWD